MSLTTIFTPPKTTKRHADERGTVDYGWLQANFTFSFGAYRDPNHMGFRSLRVMNNDTIQPSGGFSTHPHDNMEIFTYVVTGQLAHRDSMGNGAIIQAGDLQYMSAASGVQHSEFNPSGSEATTMYQIWLEPNVRGGQPRYAEKKLGGSAARNAIRLLFSGTGRGGSTEIRQDAEISFGRVDPESEIVLPGSSSMPNAWVQVVRGGVEVLGETLAEGDGLAIEDHPASIPLFGVEEDSQLLLFRLA